MKVSGFMIPAEKVVTVHPDNDTVRTVMDLMLENNIGAVVVVEIPPAEGEEKEEGKLPMPCGIITKSDILKAYHSRVGIDEPCRAIMCCEETRLDGELVTCTPSMSRDNAAKILEHNHTHHIIVVDDETHSHFVGLVSSWDISAECARDDRAWPWLRNEKGHPVFPTKAEKEKKDAQNNQQQQEQEHHPTIVNHKHDEFSTYMDDLDLEGLQ